MKFILDLHGIDIDDNILKNVCFTIDGLAAAQTIFTGKTLDLDLSNYDWKNPKGDVAN